MASIIRVLTRTFAAVAGVLSLASLGLAALSSMTFGDLAWLLEYRHVKVDTADWIRHWVAGQAYMAIVGVAGLACAFGMFRASHSAFRAWAWLTTAVFAVSAVLSAGVATYEFESSSALSLLLLLSLCVASWAVARVVGRQYVAATPN